MGGTWRAFVKIKKNTLRTITREEERFMRSLLRVSYVYEESLLAEKDFNDFHVIKT